MSWQNQMEIFTPLLSHFIPNKHVIYIIGSYFWLDIFSWTKNVFEENSFGRSVGILCLHQYLSNAEYLRF